MTLYDARLHGGAGALRDGLLPRVTGPVYERWPTLAAIWSAAGVSGVNVVHRKCARTTRTTLVTA